MAHAWNGTCLVCNVAAMMRPERHARLHVEAGRRSKGAQPAGLAFFGVPCRRACGVLKPDAVLPVTVRVLSVGSGPPAGGFEATGLQTQRLLGWGAAVREA